MSRIIIKNLPQSGVNEIEIKRHFADIDNVTDIKLNYNDRGNFRRFAFVGFKTPEGATKAIEKLNNSFIGSSKIAIEPCKAIRDIKPEKVSLIRPHESNNDETKKKKKSHKADDPLEEVRDDPEFKEFLALQRNIGENAQSKHIWSDDVRMDAENFGIGPEEVDDCQEDDEEQHPYKRHHRSRPKKKSLKAKPKELFIHTAKIKGFPPEVRRKDVLDFFKPLQVISVRLNKKDGVCYASFKDDSDLRFALRKNNQFWTTFRIKMWRHDIKRSRLFKETIQDKSKEKQMIMQKQKELVAKTEPIEESGRLFVRNLNYSCTQDDLEQVFSKYGELTEVHFPIDKKSSMPKGYAYVEFMFPKDAKCAYDELNGTIFQGRNFHIIPSEPKPGPRFNNGVQPQNRRPIMDGQKEVIIKTNDGPEEMKPNPGEVEIKQPARMLPPPKQEEILPKTDNNKAGELETHPEPSRPASSSTFKKDKLLKQKETAPRASNWNILFLGQNALADVVSDAKGINKSALLTQQSRKEPIAVRMALGDATVVEEMRKFLISNGVELDSFDNPQAPRSRTVILVKNLPSSTDKAKLQQLFERHGRVGRIILPPNGMTAIVEMDEPVEAKLAFKRLAYSKFNHSVLYLEWAPINVFREKSLEDQEQAESKQLARLQTGTKILVKNVPFEASQAELKKIFAAHGELNFVRLPKKIDGSHRGFGFVDYLTREEALRAFRTLGHSTHLYGRRLVLEWAKVEADNKQEQ